MSSSDRILRLHIQLDDCKPVIWRRVEMPATASLKALHDLNQAVMPFEDRHLFEFRVEGKRYAISDPEWDSPSDKTLSAKKARTGQPAERGLRKWAYTYDFGDDWRFTIEVEAVEDADPMIEYPRFINGEGRALPEDVGGLPDIELLLEASADPKHESHAELMKWHGGPFEPNDIPRNDIIRRVQKFARRRSLGKAGFAKAETQSNELTHLRPTPDAYGRGPGPPKVSAFVIEPFAGLIPVETALWSDERHHACHCAPSVVTRLGGDGERPPAPHGIRLPWAPDDDGPSCRSGRAS